jgi:outer membrane protein OmpA-like peptidoglycan-associated protein
VVSRRFRLGLGEIHLVRRRDVVRVSDSDHARTLARRIVEHTTPGDLGQIVGDGDTPGEDALARALASGDVVLVRIADAPRSLDPPRTYEGPQQPVPRTDPSARTSFIAIEIVNETGGRYPGAALVLELPDGDLRDVVLDDRSRARIDDIAAGICRARTLAPLQLSDDQQRRPSSEPVVFAEADVPVSRTSAVSVSLRTGALHRLVVQRPRPQPTRAFDGAVFALESAFPTPGVAAMLRHAAELVAEHRRNGSGPLRLGLFGHCDPSGDEDYNKALSDRRAQAVYALMTSDLEMFEKVAKDDAWGTDAYQAMLRALGNNPGAIDGEIGDLTRAAIAGFREEYNLDLHHRRSGRARAWGDLPPGDELDDDTKRAIRDAYHAEQSIDIDPVCFYGPRTSGCSELNPIDAERPEKNRRVTLAVYGEGAPLPGEFPCKEGDVGACRKDDRGAFRCRFYREHFVDPSPITTAFEIWDPEWLRTPTGKAHLSALTSLPDTNDVKIEIQICTQRSPMQEDGAGAMPESFGTSIAVLPGLVRAGVVYGLWTPPNGYDPFDPKHWFRIPGEDEPDPWLLPFRPPVFNVDASGHWLVGLTPGHLAANTRVLGDAPQEAIALRSDGKLILTMGRDAIMDDDSPPRIIALLPIGATFKKEVPS